MARRITMGLAGVYLSVHTPRYCTYDAAFAGKLAHPNFQAVRDGMVAQGRHVAALTPDVIVINSCHLVATFPTVVDGTPRGRAHRAGGAGADPRRRLRFSRRLRA